MTTIKTNGGIPSKEFFTFKSDFFSLSTKNKKTKVEKNPIKNIIDVVDTKNIIDVVDTKGM